MTSFSRERHDLMWLISKHLCGGNTRPSNCRQTQNLYVYYDNWVCLGNDVTYGATSSGATRGTSNVAGDVLCLSLIHI